MMRAQAVTAADGEGRVTGGGLLKRLLPPLLIVLAGVFAYWNSFDGVFLQDDLKSIRDNPHIRVLLPLSESMSLPLWSTGTTVDGRPLLSLSFALNHRLFGPEPWGFHLVNLLIHLSAGLLLFGILRRTLDLPRFRERYERRGAWLAMAAALIWVVHPLQTESVTYIVQRAESLMGMLFLLTMYCAIRGFRRPRGVTWHLGAIMACACGMGVKQTMFSAPLLVLLYDGLFVSDSLRTALSKRRWLYVALCSTWIIVFSIIGLSWQESTIDFVEISPVRYALTQPLVILYYLRLALWPSPLVLSYGWQLEDEWVRIVFPALAILAMLAVMFRALWRRRWYGFVAAWFFLILAPTSSISPLRQAIFEHRMYLSLAAVVTLLVVGGEYAIRRACAAPRTRALLGGWLVVVAMAVLGYLTYDRNRDYHSEIGIWQDNVAHRPGSHPAQNTLGSHLQNQGRFAEAIKHHQTALRLYPQSAKTHYNMGRALLALGRTREAIHHYQEALRIKPNMAQAHLNLGNALLSLGRTPEAVELYQQAVRLRPGYALAHNNLIVALRLLGRAEEAVAHGLQAVRMNPDYAEAHSNLGDALRVSGRLQEAVGHYRRALQLRPDYAPAHAGWGNALQTLGRGEEAMAHYHKALRINPNHAGAHNSLGAIYREGGRLSDAIRHFEYALRLNPNDPVARENLRETREMMGP